MGQVKVETVAVRKKEPVSKPQPKIEARRVVVNNQVKKLHTAAAKSSNASNVSVSTPKQTVKPKQTAKATSKATPKKASSKKAVKRLSEAKKQSKKS